MVKNKIRKSLLEQGQLLPNEFISKNDLKIQSTVLNKVDLASSKNNLLYFPYKKEIRLDLIIEEIRVNSNNIYMPKIFSNKKMKFNLLSKDSILKANQYGIKEIENTEYLEPDLFNTMFIPFVGVDINGCRLGYGGGYFDRTLAGLMGSSHSKPLIIGLGYDYQILSKNLAEPHDLRYHKVVTESRMLSYNSRN